MVSVRAGRMGVKRLTARIIVREAAAREEYAATRRHRRFAPTLLEHRPLHGARLHEQSYHAQSGSDTGAEVESAFHEASGECIAVREPHAAAMAQHIEAMGDDAARDERGGRGRARRLEKVR